MAKPRLALILIPLIFLSSSLVPSYALYFLITVLYLHLNPSISDLTFCSCKPGWWVHAFPWAFRYRLDEINQNSFPTSNSHPQSHTTLSACEICIWNKLLGYLSSVQTLPVFFSRPAMAQSLQPSRMFSPVVSYRPHNAFQHSIYD